MTTTERDERSWEDGWDGHERAQRERLAELPLPDKLDWLEQAHALVRHLDRQRGRVTTPSSSDGACAAPHPAAVASRGPSPGAAPAGARRARPCYGWVASFASAVRSAVRMLVIA